MQLQASERIRKALKLITFAEAIIRIIHEAASESLSLGAHRFYYLIRSVLFVLWHLLLIIIAAAQRKKTQNLFRFTSRLFISFLIPFFLHFEKFFYLSA
jgi:hypothetical protein